MSLLTNNLMIGNWVKHKPNEWSYRNDNSNKSNFKEYFQWEDSDWYALLECTLSKEAIEPIEITEEILIRCKIPNYLNYNNIYELNNNYQIEYSHISETWNIRLSINKDESLFIVDINFLHELQNFLSSTKQELKIKLD